MRKPVANRVLLVGWAAADWQLLCPLLDQGVMPKLSSLIEVGVSGNLAPVQPLLGPMLWTSLATGKRADKHGICSRLEPLPDESGYQHVTSKSRKCQAIWNLLSAAELKSRIIGWPVTSPPEPINGTIISERSLLAPNIEPVGTSRDQDSLANFVATASSIHAAACQQLSKEPWDFAAVWYPTLTCEAAWKFQDDLLSSLLETAGADTTVILVSPLAPRDLFFGHEGVPTISNTAGHCFGIACLAGPGVRRGEVLRGATILDVVPTILSLFGLPLGEDMDGQPWLEAASENLCIRYTPTWELIASSPESSGENHSAFFSDTVFSTSGKSDCENKQMVRLIRRNQKINLALALADSDRATLAIGYWKELLADYPDDPYFPLQLISSLINTQDYLECRKIISQLTPELAEHPQVRLALAELELHDGHLEEARRLARNFVDQGFALPEWLNCAGNIFLRCKAWEEAEQTFLKSLQMQINNPVARHGLSTTYWEQDRYEDAIRESRQALQVVPSFSQARFTLAKCLQDLGKDQEAIDAFEICLSVGYHPQETHGRLAALYRFRDPIRANYHQLQSGVC